MDAFGAFGVSMSPLLILVGCVHSLVNDLTRLELPGEGRCQLEDLKGFKRFNLLAEVVVCLGVVLFSRCSCFQD